MTTMTITRKASSILLEDPIEEYAFLLWAFGKHYPTFREDINFMHAWNQRHRIILKLNPQNTIVEDMEDMIQIWMQSHG